LHSTIIDQDNKPHKGIAVLDHNCFFVLSLSS
jgi:hypothetical protein